MSNDFTGGKPEIGAPSLTVNNPPGAGGVGSNDKPKDQPARQNERDPASVPEEEQGGSGSPPPRTHPEIRPESQPVEPKR